MKRKRITVFGVLSLALVGMLTGGFLYSKSRTSQMFGEIIDRVETDRPVVALTFDDGPSARFTQDVLAILRQRGVTATFFLTGKEAEDYVAGARAIVRSGHEVGNHSYSHSDMTLMRLQTVADEIQRTDAAIRAAGYQNEILFRPPYGKKLFSLPWYLAQHGRKTIMWDVEPESYADIADDADAIARHVIDKARNGSIILLHVMYRSRAASREALPKVIDGLRQRGFDFVTVSQLLAGR